MDTNQNTEPIIRENEKHLVRGKEFDGIKEFDNPPPPWLMWLFYVSIIFSGLYLAHYHFFKQGDLQDAEYENELAKASMMKEEVKNLDAIKPFTEPKDLETGKKMYIKMNCASCHGQSGEGNQVGPNLTDDYWIHGNQFEQLIEMIANGKLEKGMTPFKDLMTETEIRQAASFVLSLHGTNPPNAKAPQGIKF